MDDRADIWAGCDTPSLHRQLEDGRLLVAYPLTFGRGRLGIGDDTSFEDEW